MGLENTKASFTIEVNQTGTGATEATNQLAALNAQANTLSQSFTSLNNTNFTFATATTQATREVKAHTEAMHGAAAAHHAVKLAVKEAATLAFPQFAFAAHTAKIAVEGLSAVIVGSVATAGLMVTSMAALGAAIVSAYDGVQMVRARFKEGETGADLAKSMEDNIVRLQEQNNKYLAEGKITVDTFKAINKALIITIPAEAESSWSADSLKKFEEELGHVADRIKQVKEVLEKSKTTTAQEDIAQFNRTQALADANIKLHFDAIPKKDQEVNLQMLLNKELELHNKLLVDGKITEREYLALNSESQTKEIQGLAQVKQQLTEIQSLGQHVAENFASGFASAFVAFASGTKSAKDAFREFASQMLKQTAEMMLQMAIMRALFGAAGASTGTGGLIGGLINSAPKGAAEGGMFPKMMASGGMAGVSSVSQATYFPKFNVVAGEAGREMMTVLAQPRMMSLGGMQAMVGSAQGNQLAITNASDLANRGGVDIRVTLSPELKAEIISDSVKGARVTVANDMRSDTPISRGVKGLTG